jgi:hypothetical protein
MHMTACSPSPVNIDQAPHTFGRRTFLKLVWFSCALFCAGTMSGLEIAGLALGAFPVILRLLEDYRKGAEVMGDWWRIRRAYEEWKHDLDYYQTAFELNSKLILTPLMVDDELEQFINNPTGQSWKDQVWEARLRDRLSDSYDAVLRLVGGINGIMLTMRKELGVNNTNLQTKMDEASSSIILPQPDFSDSVSLERQKCPRKRRCAKYFQHRQHRLPKRKIQTRDLKQGVAKAPVYPAQGIKRSTTGPHIC